MVEPTEFIAEPQNDKETIGSSTVTQNVAGTRESATYDYDNDLIIVGSSSSTLGAYQTVTGGFKLQWEYDTQFRGSVDTASYMGNGEVVAIDDDGETAVLSTVDGSEIWTHTADATDGRVRGGVGFDANFIATKYEEGDAVKFDRSNGDIIWSSDIKSGSDDRGSAHAAITGEGNIFLVTIDDSGEEDQVYLLDGDDGSVFWSDQPVSDRPYGGAYLPAKEIGLLVSGNDGTGVKYDLTETSNVGNAEIGRINLPTGSTSGSGQDEYEVTDDQYVVVIGSDVRIYNIEDELIYADSTPSTTNGSSGAFHNDTIYYRNHVIGADRFIPDRPASVRFESDNGIIINGSPVAEGNRVEIDNLRLDPGDELVGFGEWSAIATYLEQAGE